MIGRSKPPKPQGPYIIKPGANINIPFKNVFRENKIFNIKVNEELFCLKSERAEIDARKVILFRLFSVCF